MVLVSYTPYNHPSLLQTKFRYRKGYEARCMGLEAMPLDQHIEERHREREPCLKIRPLAVHDFLEVADERQHRQDRLHQHAILPLAPLTEFQVGGIAWQCTTLLWSHHSGTRHMSSSSRVRQ